MTLYLLSTTPHLFLAWLLVRQVGYLILGMRSTKEARVGDTLMAENSTAEPLPGFKPARPMVFVRASSQYFFSPGILLLAH